MSTTERRVSYLSFFFFLKKKIPFNFLAANLADFLFLLSFSLSIKRIRQLPALFFLMSPNLRYVSFLYFSFFFARVHFAICVLFASHG